jgi:hypothetical protein
MTNKALPFYTFNAPSQREMRIKQWQMQSVSLLWLQQEKILALENKV